MAKTATQEKVTSKKKLTPDQTNAKKSQQEKKALASAQSNEKKQRKEQAKQEAKLMLKAEQAKKDVQKAEQKLAKAQTHLEDARTQQQTIEQKLAELRTPRQNEVSHNGVPEASDTPLTSLAQGVDTPLSLTTPFITQSADTSDTTEVPDASIAEAQDVTSTNVTSADNTGANEPDQQPVEGRTDISADSQEQNTEGASVNETSATESADSQIEIGSDTASMPLISHDANTWPPPLIREEVAEAAKQVEASDASATQETHTYDDGIQNSSSSEKHETEGQVDGSGDSTPRRRTRKTTD